MKTILYTSEADEDLFRIYHYTRIRYGLNQADSYIADMKRSAESIAAFPFIGRRYYTKDNLELRRYPIGRHVLFYAVEDENISIKRVLHDQMNFDDHLGQ